MSKCRYDLSEDCNNTDCLSCVLNKIIAEIETDLSFFCFDDWGNENTTWKEVKAIIDKYRVESEEV